MDIQGNNPSFLLVQLFNLLLIGGWLLATIVALLQLRGRGLPPIAQAIWTFLIIVVPYLGALAFFLIRPDAQKSL